MHPCSGHWSPGGSGSSAPLYRQVRRRETHTRGAPHKEHTGTMLTKAFAGATHAPLPAVGTSAVLRASCSEDIVVALPALAVPRATHPSAEIVLRGRRWHADFLTGRPGPSDGVIPIPPHCGVGELEGHRADPAPLDRSFATMAAERFDLAPQLHGDGRERQPPHPATRRVPHGGLARGGRDPARSAVAALMQDAGIRSPGSVRCRWTRC